MLVDTDEALSGAEAFKGNPGELQGEKLIELAIWQAALGQLREAESTLRALIQHKGPPEERVPKAQVALARSLLATMWGRSMKAIKLSIKALSADPSLLPGFSFPRDLQEKLRDKRLLSRQRSPGLPKRCHEDCVHGPIVGLALIGLGYYQEALSLCPAPEGPLGLLCRCLALRGCGLQGEARRVAERVTSRWPCLPLGHVCLGLIFRFLAHYEEADDCFDRALHIDTNGVKLPLAQAGKAYNLSEWKRHGAPPSTRTEGTRELRFDWKVIDDALLTSRGELALARVFRAQVTLPTDPEGALRELDECIEAYPHLIEAYTLKVMHLDYQGRHEEARKTVSEARRIAPHHPLLLNNAAYLYSQMDALQDADGYSLLAITKDPEIWWYWETRGTICIELAEHHHDENYLGEALSAFERASRLIPDELWDGDRALLHMHWGYALGKLGRYMDAKSEFKRARELARPDPERNFEGEPVLEQKAGRNLDRIQRHLWREESPRFLKQLVCGLGAVGLGYAVFLMERDRFAHSPGDFVLMVLGLIGLIILAFYLPALTKLAVGPVKLEKTSSSARSEFQLETEKEGAV